MSLHAHILEHVTSNCLLLVEKVMELLGEETITSLGVDFFFFLKFTYLLGIHC